jgi:CO/xanthine dehydrogenase Mo-binding subunit
MTAAIIVNPDGLKNQIDGTVIQSVSRALMEEVDFNAQGVLNLHWNSYPTIRFREIPDVEIALINQPDMPPMGGGEASSSGTAAAIANAIFDAVGVRMTQAPFTPTRVRAALRS